MGFLIFLLFTTSNPNWIHGLKLFLAQLLKIWYGYKLFFFSHKIFIADFCIFCQFITTYILEMIIKDEYWMIYDPPLNFMSLVWNYRETVNQSIPECRQVLALNSVPWTDCLCFIKDISEPREGTETAEEAPFLHDLSMLVNYWVTSISGINSTNNAFKTNFSRRKKSEI